MHTKTWLDASTLDRFNSAENMYDCYDIYSLTHSRSPMYRMRELSTFVEAIGILEQFEAFKRVHPHKYRILEQFAGNGEFYQAFKALKELEPELMQRFGRYIMQDIREPENLPDNFIVSSVTDDFPLVGADLVIAPFLSIHSFGATKNGRELVKTWLSKVYEGLKLAGGGTIMLDLSEGVDVSRDDTRLAEDCVHEVPPFHPVRSRLQHQNGASVSQLVKIDLEATAAAYYDRRTGLNTSFISVDRFVSNGEELISPYKDKDYSLKLRYGSEFDTVDCLVESGFDPNLINFFAKTDGKLTHLDHIVHGEASDSRPSTLITATVSGI